MSKNRKFWRKNRKSNYADGGEVDSPLSLASSKNSIALNSVDAKGPSKNSLTLDRAIKNLQDRLPVQEFSRVIQLPGLRSDFKRDFVEIGEAEDRTPKLDFAPVYSDGGVIGGRQVPDFIPFYSNGGEVDEELVEFPMPDGPQGGLAQTAQARPAIVNPASQSSPLASMALKPIDYDAYRAEIKNIQNPTDRLLAEQYLQNAAVQEQARNEQRALLEKQADPRTQRLSDAERYFKLSSALASPTKSRGFAGLLEGGGAALGEFAGSKAKEEKAAADLKLKALQLQGMSPEQLNAFGKIGELGKGRHEFEKEADALGLKGPARQAFIKEQSKIQSDFKRAQTSSLQQKAGAGMLKPETRLKYINEQNKSGDELARMDSGVQTFAQGQKLLDDMLSDKRKGARLSATGGSYYTPTVSRETKDFQADVETVRHGVFLNNIEKMKGFGALTQAEGDRLEKAIRSLDLSQSEDKFKANLQEIRDVYSKGIKNMAQKIEMERTKFNRIGHHLGEDATLEPKLENYEAWRSLNMPKDPAQTPPAKNQQGAGQGKFAIKQVG